MTFSGYVWDANFENRMDLEEFKHGLKIHLDIDPNVAVEFKLSDDGVRRLRLMLQRYERSKR